MSPSHDLSNSLFLRHLGSNYAPTDLEVLQIQDYISKPMERLAEIDRKVEELLAEKAKLVALVDAHRVLVHPIRRVPQEILQLIFEGGLPTDQFPSMGSVDAPIVLTQVCRLWRSLALGTRRLWSSIHIVTTPVDDFGERELAFHTERLTQWFNMAKNEPLSISLYSQCDFEPCMADLRVRNIIFSRSQCVRELRLRISDDYLMEFFIDGKEEWPLLEKLAIDLKPSCHNVTMGTWVDHRSDDPIFKAPSLKSLDFNHVDCIAIMLALKWNQMEELRVKGLFNDPATRITFSQADVRRLLHETPQLATLQMSVNDTVEGGHLDDDYYGPPKPTDEQIALHNLTVLQVCDSTIDLLERYRSLLDNLLLPSLKHLSYDLTFIDGIVHVPSTDNHALVQFLRFQQQPILISSFSINFKIISDDALIECVRLMPLLENLWVYHEAAVPGRLVSDNSEEYGASLGSGLSIGSHFSLDDLQKFCDSRAHLAELSEKPFARLRRLHVDIRDFAPVFIPRYPGLDADGELKRTAQCELEEALKEAGVDATVTFKKHDRWWHRPLEDDAPVFNPKAGLKTMEEQLEEWPNSEAWNAYVF